MKDLFYWILGHILVLILALGFGLFFPLVYIYGANFLIWVGVAGIEPQTFSFSGTEFALRVVIGYFMLRYWWNVRVIQINK